MATIMVAPYKAGMVIHAKMNKIKKITDTIFVGHMQWAPSKIQMKTDQELYTWLERPHAGYMTKKVAIQMVAVNHAA